VRARDGKLAGKLGVTGAAVAPRRKGMTSGSHWSAAVSARCARGRPAAGPAELGQRVEVETGGALLGRVVGARAGLECRLGEVRLRAGEKEKGVGPRGRVRAGWLGCWAGREEKVGC